MIKMLFTGDIYIPNAEYEIFDKDVKEKFIGYDIKCCNLEGPVINESLKKINKIGPSLGQTESIVTMLKNNGFNLFNLANNHIMDYGIDGLKNTVKTLNEVDYIGVGLDKEAAYKPFVFEKEGLKIAILSLAENGFGCIKNSSAGYAWINEPKVKKIIYDLSLQNDFVIVNCHIGAELFDVPLPEVKILYHDFIDCGADLIIGHHPHIIQGYEIYKDKYIFYSLGNFIFEFDNEQYRQQTFCVSASFKKSENPIIELIGMKPKDNCIYLIDQESFNKKINELNEKLNSDNYIDYVNSHCITNLKKVYQNYYNQVCGISIDNPKGRLKAIMKIILKKNKFNYSFLYHNISIETHRWICERISEIEMKEGNKNEYKK